MEKHVKLGVQLYREIRRQGENYVHTGHDNSVVNHQIKLINPYPFCLKLPRETEVCQIGTSVGMCTINSFVPFFAAARILQWYS